MEFEEQHTDNVVRNVVIRLCYCAVDEVKVKLEKSGHVC